MAESPIELWVVKDKKRLWSQTLSEGQWENGAVFKGGDDTNQLIKIIDEQREMIKELHKHLMEQNKALFYLINKD